MSTFIELWKTDHGIDGWDAKTWLVARFTSREKAMEYLSARGFDFFEYGSYAHREEKFRHTMGKLTYEIRPPKIAEIPVDPPSDFHEAVHPDR